MIELRVDSVRANPFAPHPLLVLREEAGPRYLVLGIGPLEAEVIAIRLQGIEPPRPLIHDLLSAILERFGAGLQRVEISELAGHTFHARLVLERNGEEFAFDARPSDAIALALRTQAPIYAAEAVLDAAGQLPEAEVAEQWPPSMPRSWTCSSSSSTRLIATTSDLVDSRLRARARIGYVAFTGGHGHRNPAEQGLAQETSMASNESQTPEPTPDDPDADVRRESGHPGGGEGRTDEVGHSGVQPVSIPLADAEIRTMAEWGQGKRGAAGYLAHGESELIALPPALETTSTGQVTDKAPPAAPPLSEEVELKQQPAGALPSGLIRDWRRPSK